MSDSEVTRLRIDEELDAMIEDFQFSHGLEDRSASMREMMKIGYREARYPALYRLKDIGLQGSFTLFLLALVAIPFGYLTSALSVVQTWYLSLSLVMIAGFWLAVVELVRYAREWL